MTPEEMQARVLYRDGLMLVIDKPAGLPVHRGPKGGASLEDYFALLRFGLPHPPALAHRLDKDTSGCLVLGRHRKALAHLGLLFKHGKVNKTYWAVVEGGPDDDAGVIDLALGRLDQTRGWWMKPDPQGQPAVTRWTVLGRSTLPGGDDTLVGGHHSRPSSRHADQLPFLPRGVREANEAVDLPPSRRADGRSTSPSKGEVREMHAVPAADEGAPILADAERPKRFTWLALEPVTGRTHQLRVHCAAMGWPIVGDNIYGRAPRFGGPGLHLHARAIVVPIARNKEPARITAPVPAHLQNLLGACGLRAQTEFAG